MIAAITIPEINKSTRYRIDWCMGKAGNAEALLVNAAVGVGGNALGGVGAGNFSDSDPTTPKTGLLFISWYHSPIRREIRLPKAYISVLEEPDLPENTAIRGCYSRILKL